MCLTNVLWKKNLLFVWAGLGSEKGEMSQQFGGKDRIPLECISS